MAKLYCHLLMKVNYVIIAIVYVANMSFNPFRENKILAKISEFIVGLQLLTERDCLFQNLIRFQDNVVSLREDLLCILQTMQTR